jgi:ribosomal RNA-processing protein 12
MLSQILYTQVELRSFVLRALKVLVNSNVAFASQDSLLLDKIPLGVRADDISQEQAIKNVDFLRNQAESWLAVLFNVFGSVNREDRGMVGEVIAAWMSIAGDSVLSRLFLSSLLTDIVDRPPLRRTTKSLPSSSRTWRIPTRPQLTVVVLSR